MAHYHQLLEEARSDYAELNGLIPEVLKAHAAVSRASMGDGALAAKHKELIALAIAITRECDGCVVAHADRARRRGATEDEVAEMIGVTIAMNGGPATVWGPRALAAYRELASDA